MILLVLPDITTDQALLMQIQDGDDNAVIDVYEQYFPPLYQYVRMKVGDGQLAEDIVSEVFIALMQSLGKRSAPHSNLRGWLFRVARSEIAHHLSRMEQLPVINLEEWMTASSDNEPGSGLDVIEIERVRHAMRMLTPDHQEVLILRFGQHLKVQEVADMMDRSVGAVKQLQFRALDTLRQILVEPGMEAE